MPTKKKPDQKLEKKPFAMEFLEIPSDKLAEVSGGTTFVTMAITLPKHGHSHKHYDQV
jgi:hypothetical protein